MAKVQLVYDEEYKQICGKGQLGEFATEQIFNAPDDFIEENLVRRFEPTQIKIIQKIVNYVTNKNETITNVNHAKLICDVRLYKVKEIEVY